MIFHFINELVCHLKAHYIASCPSYMSRKLVYQNKQLGLLFSIVECPFSLPLGNSQRFLHKLNEI